MKMNFAGGLVVFITLLLSSCSTSPGKKSDDSKKITATDSTQRFAKNYLTDCKKLFAEARKMDSILLNQTEVDKPSAIAAIKAFTDFAFYCQNDSLCPVFLIKTAQVARAINNVPQAKLVLDRCIETYPSFKNRPAALFLLAQLYEEKTYLNNGEEARKLYQKIIDEYPKSDWALSAKGAIRFIGKTDEEILKELKKKQKR
jgi:outer membrane protein assembly factor BamD (BamD/ComL family)